MAMDFPASPTEGQTYQAPGGPLYTYHAPAWRSGAPSPQALYGRRNRIVNGAMQISQENGSTAFSALTGGYAADQWQASAVSSSAAVTAAMTKVAAPAGEITNYIMMVASPADTSAAAGEYAQFYQRIEGIRVADLYWGQATASRAAIIAFTVNLPVAGTYWVSLTNDTAAYSFLASYTISAGEVGQWVRKQVTIPAGAISAGTWSNGAVLCALLHFTFHCGSTFTGVAGFQAGNFLAGPGQALGLSTAGGCYLTNVGLYLDPDNTGVPPRWEMPDEAQELAACQRYWRSYTKYMVTGYALTGGATYGSVPFSPPMRITPTANFVSPSYSNASALLDTGSTNTNGLYQITITSTGGGWGLCTLNLNARM